MAAAIYTSCGRKGFPHAQTSPPTTTLFSFSKATPSLSTELGVSYHIIKDVQMHRALVDCARSCFMLLFSRLHHVYAVSDTTGSQSEGPSQCISYNSHTLLIHPLKFMSFQQDPLRRPSLPLSQEGHGDTRVRGTDVQ